MIGAAHDRADWQNEARTLSDRLDRYLYPQRYDGGEPYAWTDLTVQDIADTLADVRAEQSRRRPPAAPDPPDQPAVFPSSVYAISARDIERDRWDVMRGDVRVVTLSLDGIEAFLAAVDAGLAEFEAARRAVSEDLARHNR